MKYIVEILKQFNTEQRFIVLVILLIFISVTYIITAYLKSPQRSCHDLMELNQKYVKDFVAISDMIRKKRMKQLESDTSNIFEYEIGGNELDTLDGKIMFRTDTISKPKSSNPEKELFDSILSISESNLEVKK